MSEIIVSGAISFQPEAGAPDGGRYFIYNRVGQSWGVPTRDITPADLRAMANHLEAYRASQTRPGYITETRTEAGELVAITLQDEEYRVLEVLYEAPAPDPNKDICILHDDAGRISLITHVDLESGAREVLYRRPVDHHDPLPADYDAEGGQAGWAEATVRLGGAA